MQEQLPMLPVTHKAWLCLEAWEEGHIRSLQSFWICCKMHDHDELECGPERAMQNAERK